MSNAYTFCAGCGFGIELSVPGQGGTRSEYVSATGKCYTCTYSHRPRAVGTIKRLLADSEVLLKSAQRVSDFEATAFYTHQVARCKEALGETAAQGTQRNLF